MPACVSRKSRSVTREGSASMKTRLHADLHLLAQAPREAQQFAQQPCSNPSKAPEVPEMCQRRNIAICRNCAISRNLQQSIVLPSLGRGRWFDRASPPCQGWCLRGKVVPMKEPNEDLGPFYTPSKVRIALLRGASPQPRSGDAQPLAACEGRPRRGCDRGGRRRRGTSGG